jgi:DNA-directed RNA polymerase specialized sigma24 family protein/CheY-like chemotaxis protein
MPISAAIGPYLPLLRRFARALSGSQPEGDGYVAATLESILADRASFAESLGARIALYRAFVRIWSANPANADLAENDNGEETAAARRLAAIPIAPRVAFLLSALESFKAKEIALILDCSESDARELLQHAAREVAHQMRTNVLIIEDEPLIALDLHYIVEQLGHKVETIARTQVEAVRVAGKSKPGLILADIQLADGSSGLAAVNEILEKLEAPVIFITAFPERLLTGHAPEPAFLITKPFSTEAVKAAISQALFFERKPRRAPGAAP